jgi:hypothetical protein
LEVHVGAVIGFFGAGKGCFGAIIETGNAAPGQKNAEGTAHGGGIILAKADENEMSVYLMNAYEDSVLAPEVEVGDEYVRVEVCNGSAELKDGKVTLSDIHPFGFTAFTVYKK